MLKAGISSILQRWWLPLCRRGFGLQFRHNQGDGYNWDVAVEVIAQSQPRLEQICSETWGLGEGTITYQCLCISMSPDLCGLVTRGKRPANQHWVILHGCCLEQSRRCNPLSEADSRSPRYLCLRANLGRYEFWTFSCRVSLASRSINSH